MSWSYNVNNLSSSLKDQVRLQIGDTDADSPILEDEEIAYSLEICTNDVMRASFKCVTLAIAKLCNLPDYTLGPYSESNGNRLKSLLFLQDQLKKGSIGLNAPIMCPPTTEPIFEYDGMSKMCCIKKEV